MAFLRSLVGPSPRKLVPEGISPLFARRLTGNSLMVGRKSCCDLVLPLPTVSGHHCRLYRDGRSWYIEDLASCNGTLVNDHRVQRKRIRVGDIISVGDFRFAVR